MRKHKLAFVGLAAVLSLGVACQSGDSGGDNNGGGSDQPAPPTDRILRRLTRFEYDNSIKDLFGVDAQLGQTLPPENVVNAFDNNAGALTVGPLMADKLQLAAESLADLIAKNLPQNLGCDPKLGRACAEVYTRAFGLRALRRPLTDAEVGRYLALHDQTVADYGDFNEGIKAVIIAMLQSPYFVYRSELGQPADGGVYRLTPYEIATELSYFLWGSTPDAELQRAAQAGELATSAQILAQAKRLLSSPRSRPVMDHFLRQWLHLDRLFNATKDAQLFPTYTTAIRTAMDQETTAFFDAVIRGGGKFPELLNAKYTYASASLAQFYGLQPSGAQDAQGLYKLALPDGRLGLLTHGSLLSTQAKPDTPSPVHRGKLVRERLLCQTLPPPPPGVVIQLPPVDASLSNRLRFKQHSADPACSACHRLMDPIGLGFERFDAVGRYAAMANGALIDDSGEIIGGGSAAGTFQGVAALAERLSQAPEAQECFARQWFRYAYGIEEDSRTEAQATQTIGRFKDAGLVMSDLLLALTQVPRFTERAADPGVGPQPDKPTTPSPDMASPPPPPPPPPSMYAANVKRDSDWQTGYCSTVVVVNNGQQAGDWSVTIAIEGTINNLWNADQSGTGAQITFRGKDYNKSLAPGASTSFGFCATK